MTKFGLAVFDSSDTCVRLDQLCKVAYIPNETKREFFCGPDATIPLDFKLFVKFV